MKLGEIVLYQPEDRSVQIEVRIEEDTVWLTQSQLVELFDSTKQLLGYPRSDIDQVNWVRGYMTAYEEILNINFEDTNTND